MQKQEGSKDIDGSILYNHARLEHPSLQKREHVTQHHGSKTCRLYTGFTEVKTDLDCICVRCPGPTSASPSPDQLQWAPN